jgi:GTP pyrophosphokinase
MPHCISNMVNLILPTYDVTLFERIFVALQYRFADERADNDVPLPFYRGREVAAILDVIGCDKETIIAALLFEAGDSSAESRAHGQKVLEAEGLAKVWPLVSSLRSLRSLKSPIALKRYQSEATEQSQLEVLRRMLLAMVNDERVALVYLASALQHLRSYAALKQQPQAEVSLEALQLLSPLANRLGLWQLKWEIEDLAFRFSDPTTYKQIATLLEEKRTERATFIEDFTALLTTAIANRDIPAEVAGRPKHIYSIHKKMQAKNLPLSGLSDLHAFRVIVDSVKDCYAVLAVVHERWEAIGAEYDDYIARPKANGYQSLHTIVLADDGRSVEIQIRTREMHQFAEYGVASHWRYKENQAGQSGKVSGLQSQEARVAAMRQILAWQDDVAHSIAVPAATHVYAMTPQGRVVELPKGSTPIDFAYHVHSDLGHRCRGAKVNGHLVPLTTVLENGETVEVLASKAVRVTPAEFVLQTERGTSSRIGPSRDWLNPQLKFLVSARAKTKVRQWFNAIEELRAARAVVEPEPPKVDIAKSEVTSSSDDAAELLDSLNKPKGTSAKGLHDRSPSASDVLVVGVDFLMTQLAKCCRPLPPDEIEGFVTRGHGISIHRRHCKSFKAMVSRSPERVLPCAWGSDSRLDASRCYPVDVQVHAYDRQGLLRDITDTLAREKINVVAASTQSRDQIAYIRKTPQCSACQCYGHIRCVRRQKAHLLTIGSARAVRRLVFLELPFWVGMMRTLMSGCKYRVHL